MPDLFPTFPDEARLWIYAASRPLEEAEQARLCADLAPFFEGWTAHGHPVKGAAGIRDDRFLFVAGYVPGGDLSGCGIDASIDAVEAAIRGLGASWLSSLDVLFRGPGGRVEALARPAFRAAVRRGEVTAATPVFDLSLTTVGALRAGHFERPAAASWHAAVFRIPAG